MIISRDLFILGDEYFSVTSKSRYEMKNFETNCYKRSNNNDLIRQYRICKTFKWYK